MTATLGGRFLMFQLNGPKYDVISRRGGLLMGDVSFRSQWMDWCFTPHPEARLNAECMAEVYAFMRSRQRSQSWPQQKRWYLGIEESELGPTLVIRLPFWSRSK